MAALLEKKAIQSPEDYARVVPPPPLTDGEYLALRVWREMGHRIDWNALPFLLERHAVEDSDQLVEQLLIIRDTRRSDAT